MRLMIRRPLVFILPGSGALCPESNQGSGKVTGHTGDISKGKEKGKIQHGLGGVSAGSGVSERL